MGRAARNINGKAIMYADNITNSMSRAIEETKRRRDKQIQYNTDHNIKPKTIIKNVQDVMDNARNKPSKQFLKIPKSIKGEFNPDDPNSISKIIDKLELEMFDAAKDLRFEDAAKIRDEIKLIKDFNFGINFIDAKDRVTN